MDYFPVPQLLEASLGARWQRRVTKKLFCSALVEVEGHVDINVKSIFSINVCVRVVHSSGPFSHFSAVYPTLPSNDYY